MLTCCVILMDAIKAIMERRSVRSYTGEMIPKDDLQTIIKAGMAAPSAMDVRPWSFIIVKDKESLKQLSELPHTSMLESAGQAIVVCGVLNSEVAKAFWVQDCSAVTENILLAAHALNYGAVWTGVFPVEDKVTAVKEILKMPEDIIPLCVIPLGIEKDSSKPKDKFNPDLIHYDKW